MRKGSERKKKIRKKGMELRMKEGKRNEQEKKGMRKGIMVKELTREGYAYLFI